jgi:glycine cleavage system H protein
MATIYYTKQHEYVRVEGDLGIVGISDYAQEQLGDVVYVELPETGRIIKQGEEVAVVESVKAASEVYAPVSGEVVEANTSLERAHGLINESPESEGWFWSMKLTNRSELEGLMDEEAYRHFLATIS